MPDGNDWFRYPSNQPIRPFELNNEGSGKALVLRYALCNLSSQNCPLCYAWRYAWKKDFAQQEGKCYQYNTQDVITALNNVPRNLNQRIVWVRIQGGEPCINYPRILNTITYAKESLIQIHQMGLNPDHVTRAVIQTNGLRFSFLKNHQKNNIMNHLRNALTDLETGRIVFEVSFKSPHGKIFNWQQKGFNVLLNDIIQPLWNQGLHNVAIYPIAGLGPTIDTHNKWLIPIDPSKLPQETPLFHQSTWSSNFQDMINYFINTVASNNQAYTDFRNNPFTDQGTKIALQELEPERFQSSWISGYAGGYKGLNLKISPIDTILRKMSSSNLGWLEFFGRYPHWRNVINQIPAVKKPINLLTLIQSMNTVFYPAHPTGHYPSL